MDLGPNDGKLLWRGPPRYEQTQTACRYQIRKDFMLKNFANIPLEGTAQRYVLTTPTSAVIIESGTKKVISVPNNSVVDVEAPLNGTQGLIEVKLNGATVLMFAEDILRLGERSFSASA